MSHNTYASGVWIDNFGARVDHWTSGTCSQTAYQAGYLYNQNFYGCHLTGVQVYGQNVYASGTGVLWSGKFNVVKKILIGSGGNSWATTGEFYQNQDFSFVDPKFGNVSIDIQNLSYNSWVTDWGWGTTDNYGRIYKYQTLTVAWTMTGLARSNINGQTAKMTVAIFPSGGHSSFDQINILNEDSPYYFENTGEAMEIQFTSNGLEGLDQLVQQNTQLMQQNQTMINQNQQIINMAAERNAKEDQSLNNISNQNSGDISGAENAQTTNIIGIIQSFINQLGSFNATSCSLSMPFPSFFGGDTNVNICQGKDVLGNFISVVGSLFMITFYIPLAFVLLRMIYNEIRSFTNG